MLQRLNIYNEMHSVSSLHRDWLPYRLTFIFIHWDFLIKKRNTFWLVWNWLYAEHTGPAHFSLLFGKILLLWNLAGTTFIEVVTEGSARPKGHKSDYCREGRLQKIEISSSISILLTSLLFPLNYCRRRTPNVGFPFCSFVQCEG